jgi:hypothetical protein
LDFHAEGFTPLEIGVMRGKLAQVLAARGALAEAFKSAKLARTILKDKAHHRQLRESLLTLSQVEFYLGHFEEARTHFDELLASARAHADTEMEEIGLMWNGLLLVNKEGTSSVASDYFDSAKAIAPAPVASSGLPRRALAVFSAVSEFFEASSHPQVAWDILSAIHPVLNPSDVSIDWSDAILYFDTILLLLMAATTATNRFADSQKSRGPALVSAAKRIADFFVLWSHRFVIATPLAQALQAQVEFISWEVSGAEGSQSERFSCAAALLDAIDECKTRGMTYFTNLFGLWFAQHLFGCNTLDTPSGCMSSTSAASKRIAGEDASEHRQRAREALDRMEVKHGANTFFATRSDTGLLSRTPTPADAIISPQTQSQELSSLNVVPAGM